MVPQLPAPELPHFPAEGVEERGERRRLATISLVQKHNRTRAVHGEVLEALRASPGERDAEPVLARVA